jgi:multiple sugar transport system substrate-binding protein
MNEKDVAGISGSAAGPEGKALSRREFLKFAGIAGAALALGTGSGGLLGGCGSGAASTVTTGGATKASGTGSSGTITIDFSYPPFGYSADAEKAFWAKHNAAFEAANPGIKINMTWESWDNYFQKISAAVASGSVPDLSYASPPSVMPLAAQGHIASVDPIIEQLGGRAAFSSALMNQYLLNGKAYCVPNCDNTIVMCYRKDMLQKAGYSTSPATWDELVEVARATSQNGAKGFGLYLSKTYDTRQVYAGMMWAAGGSMLDKDGNVVINSAENLAALKYYTEFYTKYNVVPEAAKNWQYGDNANIIGTGQVALTPIWAGYGTLIQEMFPDTYEQIGFAELPAGPTGHSGSWSGVGGFYVFDKAKHPEEANKYIQYMSRPELQKEWCVISGNVSPFVAIAKDPELTKYEWYAAIAKQSPNAIQVGWVDSAAVPGLDLTEGSHMLADGVVGVVTEGLTPEEALKRMHDEVAKTLTDARQG